VLKGNLESRVCFAGFEVCSGSGEKRFFNRGKGLALPVRAPSILGPKVGPEKRASGDPVKKGQRAGCFKGNLSRGSAGRSRRDNKKGGRQGCAADRSCRTSVKKEGASAH